MHIKPAITWISWLVGAAACAALVIFITHFSEEQEFLHLLQQAKPGWLLLAVGLQAATYLAQGTVWQIVVRASGYKLGVVQTYKLSLAMLFVSQALPSGGVSGLAVVKAAMEKWRLPRPVIAAAVLVDSGAYYCAYGFCLLAGVLLALHHGHVPTWVIVPSLVFMSLALGLSGLIFALPGHRMEGLTARMMRWSRVAHLMEWLVNADPSLFRNRWIQAKALLCHICIFMLDAATLWVAVRALGVAVPPAGVFASFMVSSLFRTIGFMPGGLGTFEAASVSMLKWIGLSLPVGLSGTLLFRGLSFWLPMLPGMVFSRELIGRRLNPAITLGGEEQPADSDAQTTTASPPHLPGGTAR